MLTPNTDYTGAYINGKQYTMQDLQDARNQADVQAQLNKGNDMYATGADGNKYDLMSGKLIVPQATPQYVDQSANINSMYNAQAQAKLAALQQARNNAINTYQQQIPGIQQTFQNSRNQADGTNMQNYLKNNENMANNGLTHSGANVANQLAIGNQRANDINTLTNTENSQIGTINNQIAQINANGATEDAQAQAEIQAQRLSALINQANTDRAFNYQQNRDTIADNRYNQQYADSRGDVAYNRNYQTGRDAVTDANTAWNQNNTINQQNQAQSNWQNQFDYTKLSDQQKQAFQQAQFDYQKTQDQINNTYRQNSFEWQQAMDKANQAFQQKQADISQSNWQQQFNATQNQNAWDNNYKLQALQNARSGSGGSGGGSNSYDTSAYGDDNTQAVWSKAMQIFKAGGYGKLIQFLTDSKSSIINSTSKDEYQALRDYATQLQEAARQNEIGENKSMPW